VEGRNRTRVIVLGSGWAAATFVKNLSSKLTGEDGWYDVRVISPRWVEAPVCPLCTMLFVYDPPGLSTDMHGSTLQQFLHLLPTVAWYDSSTFTSARLPHRDDISLKRLPVAGSSAASQSASLTHAGAVTGTVDIRSIIESTRSILRGKGKYHEAECISVDPERKVLRCRYNKPSRLLKEVGALTA
jgi:hypothetical protein